MKAVILAAGLGSRLRPLTNEKPKCLLELNKNFTILDYQINSLLNVAKLEPSDIFIVTGYKKDIIEKHLKNKGLGDINIIFNEYYDKYNNIYSFYLIKSFVKSDFYLFNGDTLFDRKILENLSKNEEGTYFVVDNVKKLGEEEMKVLIKDDRIIKFGKDINPVMADGEYIGLSKFNWEDAKVIFNKIEDLLSSGKTNIWYEIAINSVLDKVYAKPVYTNGLPWIEIDTKDDYKKGLVLFKKIISSDLNDL